LPEVITVIEPRELTPSGATEETIEGGERNVFLVCNTSLSSAEPRSGQSDETVEVTLPDALSSIAFALLQ
jgi:hypothetical protein